MYNNTAENKRLDMGSKNLSRKKKGEQFWSYQATRQHVQFNVVSSHSSSVIGVRIFAMLFKKWKKCITLKKSSIQPPSTELPLVIFSRMIYRFYFTYREIHLLILMDLYFTWYKKKFRNIKTHLKYKKENCNHCIFYAMNIYCGSWEMRISPSFFQVLISQGKCVRILLNDLHGIKDKHQIVFYSPVNARNFHLLPLFQINVHSLLFASVVCSSLQERSR